MTRSKQPETRPETTLRLVCLVFAFAALAAPALAQTRWVRKEAVDFESYYLLQLPKNHDPKKPYPLLISLHGAASNAEDFVALWSILAYKRGYVLAVPCGDWKAPEWNDRQRSWGEKSPEFFRWIVSDIRKTSKIDPDRIFLNGFSAGGHMTLYAGILDSDFYCAVVACSGCLMDAITDEELQKARSLPIRLLVGGKDMNHAAVLKSAQRLEAAGFTNVVLRQFPRLAHQYPVDENYRVLEWFDKMHAERMMARIRAAKEAEARKALDDQERKLKDCAAWFDEAESCMENGEKEKAAELYRKIIELMPDSELGKKSQDRLAAMK